MPESFARAQDRFEDRGRKIFIGLLVVAVLLLFVAMAAGVRTLRSTTSDYADVEHTLEVQNMLGRLNGYAERIETARRGFIIQPDPTFASNLQTTRDNFDRTLEEIGTMVADNADQVERTQRLAELAREKRSMIDRMLAMPDFARGRLQESDLDGERGTLITRDIRDTIRAMNETEAGLLERRNREQLRSLVRFYAVAAIAIALLLVVMGTAIVLILRYNRQLTGAQKRLRLANEGLESAVDARTSELTRANAEIQRFAYIVSHDLRSPLVNVLGFTSELDEARKVLRAYLEKLYEERPELRDEAAWLAVDEDLPEAAGFIRTSTEKMDRLISSILELSRQGRRTLNPEPLDMDEVADSIVKSLHQRTEDAGAEIEVKPLPDVESDRIAVEQVLSNLVENALKYLSPARAGRVRIEGGSEGNRVFYDVIDNGRGIDPADHSRVFDLFRRAGVQDQQGEGIGLANARALAYRLGGTLDVESKLDEGARFRFTLPARFIAVETSQ